MNAAERTSDAPARAAPGGKYALVLGVMGAVLLLDLLSKAWVQSRFHLGESVELLGDWVRLTYILNPGAAFGINVGPWSRPVFATLAVLAAAVLAALVRQTPAADRVRLSALALILGGALGNLVDRLRSHGAVVDFLDFGVGALRWPVFNVADVGITCGAVLLVVLIALEKPPGSEPAGEGAREESAASPAAPARR